MLTSDLYSNLANQNYKVLLPNELTKLLSSAEIITEQDTIFSDKIRILKINDQIIVQECSDKNEFLIRYVPGINAAEKFLSDRLGKYERMWDG